MRFVTPTPLQTIERVYFNHVGSWLAASSRNELIRTVLQYSPGILIQTKFLEAQKSKKRSCTFLKLIVILSFRNAQIDSESLIWPVAIWLRPGARTNFSSFESQRAFGFGLEPSISFPQLSLWDLRITLSLIRLFKSSFRA